MPVCPGVSKSEAMHPVHSSHTAPTIRSANHSFPDANLSLSDFRAPIASTKSNDERTTTKLFDRKEAAAFLHLRPQTLSNWAVSRAHPLPYIKLGRRVMYRLSDLEAFVLANRHCNEAVTGRAHV
jgi:hypothetical protein